VVEFEQSHYVQENTGAGGEGRGGCRSLRALLAWSEPRWPPMPARSKLESIESLHICSNGKDDRVIR
jgi:hypothetical protein